MVAEDRETSYAGCLQGKPHGSGHGCIICWLRTSIWQGDAKALGGLRHSRRGALARQSLQAQGTMEKEVEQLFSILLDSSFGFSLEALPQHCTHHLLQEKGEPFGLHGPQHPGVHAFL